MRAATPAGRPAPPDGPSAHGRRRTGCVECDMASSVLRRTRHVVLTMNRAEDRRQPHLLPFYCSVARVLQTA